MLIKAINSLSKFVYFRPVKLINLPTVQRQKHNTHTRARRRTRTRVQVLHTHTLLENLCGGTGTTTTLADPTTTSTTTGFTNMRVYCYQFVVVLVQCCCRFCTLN